MEILLICLLLLVTSPLWMGPFIVLLVLSIPLAIISIPVIAIVALLKFIIQ